MGRSDSKIWESLTPKKGRTDPIPPPPPKKKNGKDSLETLEGLIWKIRSTVSKNGKVWAKTRK